MHGGTVSASRVIEFHKALCKDVLLDSPVPLQASNNGDSHFRVVGITPGRRWERTVSYGEEGQVGRDKKPLSETIAH